MIHDSLSQLHTHTHRYIYKLTTHTDDVFAMLTLGAIIITKKYIII